MSSATTPKSSAVASPGRPAGPGADRAGAPPPGVPRSRRSRPPHRAPARSGSEPRGERCQQQDPFVAGLGRAVERRRVGPEAPAVAAPELLTLRRDQRLEVGRGGADPSRALGAAREQRVLLDQRAQPPARFVEARVGEGAIEPDGVRPTSSIRTASTGASATRRTTSVNSVLPSGTKTSSQIRPSHSGAYSFAPRPSHEARRSRRRRCTSGVRRLRREATASRAGAGAPASRPP